MEIPELQHNRTVGKQKESSSRDWKDRCKHISDREEKPPVEGKV